MAVFHRASARGTERGEPVATESTKVGGKPHQAKGMPGAGLTGAWCGKAPAERPALKPYRGKPAVRNFRGDDGNVGIIRSPVRAIVLPVLLSSSHDGTARIWDVALRRVVRILPIAGQGRWSGFSPSGALEHRSG